MDRPKVDLCGMRLLLAEDNPINRKVAIRQLEGLGCEVKAVANGIEALTEFENGAYDAILMDCQMPSMDGYEATSHIRKLEHSRGGHIPVIALTANALEGDRDRCISCGMDDYLSKPVRPHELVDILQRWHGAGRLRDAA